MTGTPTRITMIKLRLHVLAQLQRRLKTSQRRFSAKAWAALVAARQRL
jgi:hypothetical protein